MLGLRPSHEHTRWMKSLTAYETDASLESFRNERPMKKVDTYYVPPATLGSGANETLGSPRLLSTETLDEACAADSAAPLS